MSHGLRFSKPPSHQSKNDLLKKSISQFFWYLIRDIYKNSDLYKNTIKCRMRNAGQYHINVYIEANNYNIAIMASKTKWDVHVFFNIRKHTRYKGVA